MSEANRRAAEEIISKAQRNGVGSLTGGFLLLADGITAALDAAEVQGAAKAIKAAAKQIPTTWLDELLTGPSAPLPRNTPGPAVEAFCRGLADRIRALSPSEVVKEERLGRAPAEESLAGDSDQKSDEARAPAAPTCATCGGLGHFFVPLAGRLGVLTFPNDYVKTICPSCSKGGSRARQS